MNLHFTGQVFLCISSLNARLKILIKPAVVTHVMKTGRLLSGFIRKAEC